MPISQDFVLSPISKRELIEELSSAILKKIASAFPTINTEEVITSSEAIKLLKTNRTTFYQWVKDGKINSVRKGTKHMFIRADIVAAAPR